MAKTVRDKSIPSYLSNGPQRLDWLLKKLSREVIQPNLDYLLQYRADMERSNKTVRTQVKRLSELRAVCKLNVCKDFKRLTAAEVDEIVRQVSSLKAVNRHPHTEPDRLLYPYSRSRIKIAFKRFVLWLNRDNRKFDKVLVEWIKRDGKSADKLPTEMLDESDIEKLILASKNLRSKTLLSLLWDSGCRIGEALNCKRKSVVL